jgi:thioredoxin 1
MAQDLLVLPKLTVINSINHDIGQFTAICILLICSSKPENMKSSFKKIISSETPVLVDFFAEWCGPCKMLAPILKEVKEELGDAVKIVKIDVDTNQSIATKYQVKGVPTMLLFKNGKQVWRQSGVLQKKDIVQIIQSQN